MADPGNIGQLPEVQSHKTNEWRKRKVVVKLSDVGTYLNAKQKTPIKCKMQSQLLPKVPDAETSTASPAIPFHKLQ